MVHQVRAFRGEPGLEDVEVEVAGVLDVPAAEVAADLAAFEGKLAEVMERLDARYPHADDLDADCLEAVIDLAAWAHAEWVRIHPFANGNGRTARLRANFVFMRYGIEPVLRLRPGRTTGTRRRGLPQFAATGCRRPPRCGASLPAPTAPGALCGRASAAARRPDAGFLRVLAGEGGDAGAGRAAVQPGIPPAAGRRRRDKPPSTATPASHSAQVPGSGTAVTFRVTSLAL